MTRRDGGQAAVEFAIALPLVVIALLGLVQVAVVVRDQVTAELAAREGARAASVSGAPADAATNAARRAAGDAAGVAVTSTGEWVTVEVTIRNDTAVPIVGAVLGPVDLTASVTMQREPP